MSTVTADAPTIEIRGASYAVEALAPGFAGTAAVRLVKLVNGESYAVVLQADGHATCECPDYVCRRADSRSLCKHGSACLAEGLLTPKATAPAPAPGPAVAPITPADRKRARMWGLKLPAVAPVAELAPEIPAEEESPAWTWDAWTDADVWELGPDDAPDGEPSPSWDAPRFEPEDIAAAYEAGYQIGRDGEYPRPPAHYSPREAHHFNCGRLAGFIASPDGRAWYRDLETLEDRPASRETDGYPAGYCS